MGAPEPGGVPRGRRWRIRLPEGPSSRPAHLEGAEVWIQEGREAELQGEGATVALLDGAPGTVRFTADRRAAALGLAESLRGLRVYTDRRPLSSRLPFSYQWVPPPARRFAARVLGRRLAHAPERWAAFPGWPLDLSADLMADLAEAGSTLAPAARPRRVVLTHDIDSPEGLRNLEGFTALEEAVGAHSTSFVVPCGWELDHAALGRVASRGHEIGVHGHDHGNRTPYLEEGEIRSRMDRCRRFVERYGARGYRAPSLLRTRRLLRVLADHFAYDASVPTSGGAFPVPNNGCASARPFRLEGLPELPLSLPRDGSLRFLGHAPEAILDLWRATTRRVLDSGGVAVLLTHCEAGFSGNPPMQDVYRRYLEWVAGLEGVGFALAADCVR